jgi:hypothetical protein
MATHRNLMIGLIRQAGPYQHRRHHRTDPPQPSSLLTILGLPPTSLNTT